MNTLRGHRTKLPIYGDFTLEMQEYVYCKNCTHFHLDDENLPYCYYENECNINNFEDSRKLSERPCYKEINKY